MPLITDPRRIRAALDRDRAWCAYAIGDLEPVRLPHCSWYAPADDPHALVLLYRGFDLPILFATGAPTSLAGAFAELDAPAVSLQLRPDAVAALSPAYAVTDIREMWRMTIDAAEFRPPSGDVEVVTLNPTDADALAALYADGRESGEEPPFYQASMLSDGSFCGIREGSELVAVAGTHLFSPTFGVCAIGNVYTRRDRRRRGFAARVTSAVVRHALASAIPTIVLNVSQANEAARRVYAQLGFRDHGAFVEGEAVAARTRSC